MAVLGPTGKGSHHRIYRVSDVQRLFIWQERVSQVVLVLESNVNILHSLRRFYTQLGQNKDFQARNSCSDDIDVFSNKLDYIMDDFKLQVSRAKALLKTLSDRTELVKQHRLERLNYHMEREAIVVRIITIVTLIYLPATFTSTFFSTDIIKYQGQDSPAGNYSATAMNRWLQVTVPLTLLTLVVAYALKRWAERKALDSETTDSTSGGGLKWWKWPQKACLRGVHTLRAAQGMSIPLLPLPNQQLPSKSSLPQ